MLFLLWSCTVTCEDVCVSLASCDEISQENSNTLDCTSACLSQQEQAQNNGQEQEFNALKSCIQTNSCADIAEGVCYDENLYSW